MMMDFLEYSKAKAVRRKLGIFFISLVVAFSFCLPAADLAYAEEESDTNLFSEDYVLYKGDTGEDTLGSTTEDVPVSSKRSEDFRGAKLGAVTGATVGTLLEAYYDDDVEVVYFDSFSDCIEALETGKIDAYGCDSVGCIKQMAEDDSLAVVYPYLDTFGTSAFFAKDNEKSEKLLEEYNEFLAELKDQGGLDDLFQTYLKGEAEDLDMNFTGENGTIQMAVCSNMGIPFCYYSNNSLNGYELYIACEFAKEYGYKLEFSDYNFAGMLAAVSSGVCDFGASGVQSTYERAESVNFADSDYYAHHILVTLADQQGSQGFLSSLVSDFKKTFLQDGRWLYFVKGIGITLLITVLSAVFGTFLGYLLYRMSASGIKALEKFTDFLAWLIRGMPAVVLLMILYYIIFKNVPIAGAWVAVIAFTLTFAVAMMGMIKTGVAAIDKGQLEGATALGYTKRQTFHSIIFPQAVMHFMPLYCAEIVALIKATAVVGYIAVQDLTKVSDIIRSMTFDAFFPLIAVAILYFVLGAVLTSIVHAIEKKLDYKQRKASAILKGVKVHD